jgi:stearoyl-CoA desaturase (delta-9 desaturase)
MATVGHWLVGGWIGVIIGIAVALAASTPHGFMYVFAGGAINGFGHAHTTSRTNGGHATNMPIIAWLTVGEGWHRNHHAAENSPRSGYGHQLDPGWLAIRTLQHLRLARITTRGANGIRRFQDLRATTRWPMHDRPEARWLVVEHRDDSDDSVLFIAASRADAEEITRSLRALGQDVTVQPRFPRPQ